MPIEQPKIAIEDAWDAPRAREFFRNVWPMYVHEISGFDTDFYALDETGRWLPDIVEDWVSSATPARNLRTASSELGADQPFQRTHVIVSERRPIGFVCVGLRPFKYMPNDADLVVAEFFLIHAARGTGAGRRALELLLARYSGRWQLRVLHDNVRAARFWRTTLPLVGARDVIEQSEGRDIAFRFVTPAIGGCVHLT